MAASEGGFLEVTEAQKISAIGKCDVCRSDAQEAQIRCDNCKKWLCIDHIQGHSSGVCKQTSPSSVNEIKEESRDATGAHNKGGDVTCKRDGEVCDGCGTALMIRDDGSHFMFCHSCGKNCSENGTKNKQPFILNIEILPVTRDTECGFCYARLEEIQDPRALPCGHTQCYDCIEVNYQDKEIECKVCKEVFSDVDIEILPKVAEGAVKSALAEPAIWIPIHLRCELCKTDTVRAAVCCADCKRRFCRKHADVFDEGRFETAKVDLIIIDSEHVDHISEHVMLPIEDELTPERYEVQRCQTHKKHILDEICKHCRKMFCKRCETKQLCSGQVMNRMDAEKSTKEYTSNGLYYKLFGLGSTEKAAQNFEVEVPERTTAHNHEVVILHEVTEDMRTNLRKLSQKIYDKIKRCRDTEKSTWKRLSALEEHVETIYRRINAIGDDLIRQIKHETEALNIEFGEYVTKSLVDVDKFSDEKLLNITILDDLYISASHLADRRSDKELLEDFDKVLANLTQALYDREYDKEICLKTPYLHIGDNSLTISAKLDFQQATLEHVKTEKSPCYGVSFTEDSSILTSYGREIHVRNSTNLRTKAFAVIDQEEAVSAAVMVGDTLLTKISSFKDNKYITYIGSLEQPTQTILHSEDYDEPRQLTYLAANKDYIASIDIVNKHLKVFSFISKKHLYDIELTDMKRPIGVHLIAGTVLITDELGGSVSKYALSPSQADLIWTCTGLRGPSGVTTDDLGLIYVTELESPYIHIISPAGEKMRKLTHAKIKESIQKQGWTLDISIQDWKMALACREEGVMLFNIP